MYLGVTRRRCQALPNCQTAAREHVEDHGQDVSSNAVVMVRELHLQIVEWGWQQTYKCL